MHATIGKRDTGRFMHADGKGGVGGVSAPSVKGGPGHACFRAGSLDLRSVRGGGNDATVAANIRG
jgi:hypothetical protein